MKIPVYLRNGYNRLCIILCAAALLSGGMIYFLFRPGEALFIHLFVPDRIGYQPPFSYLHLPDWAVYSLPAGLWAFAYMLLICRIWSGTTSWPKYFWMASAPFLVFGFEILQLFKLIPGTFCIQDLVFGSMGIVAGLLIGTLKK